MMDPDTIQASFVGSLIGFSIGILFAIGMQQLSDNTLRKQAIAVGAAEYVLGDRDRPHFQWAER